MNKIIISSHEEFEKHLGKEIGSSDYITITQEQINKFADATNDHQWIHTDPERAKNESPYKETIAHGYLLISILPYLWSQIIGFENIKMMVNYGIEKLRFNQPIKVNSKVRVRVKLISIVNLRGITKAKLHAVLEIEDNNKSVLDASLLFLYHFNN